jgi:penicillin-binding protein 1C
MTGRRGGLGRQHGWGALLRAQGVALAALIPPLMAPSAAAAAPELPRFAEVRAAWRSADTVLLDRHGAVLQAVRTDPRALRGDWTALADVSPAFRQALLLSEDQRFYAHSGVDWQAVGAAAWGNLWHTRTRGASTVTMQLAGLLDADLALPQGQQPRRTLLGKLDQAATAVQLERQWRKDEILEAYLNLVGFRGEVVGVSALAATLFHKLPSGLDAEESAIAAALVRAPNAPAAQVAARACPLLQAMRHGADALPACKLLRTYTAQVLSQRFTRLAPDAQLAPHLARLMMAEHLMAERAKTPGASASPPAQLRTTLDAAVQRLARDALRQRLSELRDRQVRDGAVLVLDNASGEVLAWVGSSGAELSRAGEVDGVLAPRQAGSTLKPFLYEIAIEQRWLTAASIVLDSPVGLDAGGGLYVPQNYDHDFKGPVSLRTALASSLNVPAVRTLVMVSPDRFAQRLRALGLPLRHEGDFYGYSLALGSAEVTLASLTNAYRALANGGRYGPWRVQPEQGPHRATPMMDPRAAYIVADVLADREARVPTFGLDNALAPRYWAAVKTGTSKDMRDNWCVGFSKRYTVGVWVGNANGDPMWAVSGTTGAAPVWRAVMDGLQRRASTDDARQAARPPLPPEGLVQQPVQFDRALEPPRSEWFLAGTEQAEVRLASAEGVARHLIHTPTDHTVFALDPDIPLAAQRVVFKAVPGVSAQWAWQLDGRRIGPARDHAWPMWPGAHELALVDAQQRVVERVRFEVRGARVRTAASQQNPGEAIGPTPR